MNDRAKIIAGFAVFVLLAAFPVWRTLAVATKTAPPKLELPEDAKRCIEDTQYMNAYHMDLLNRWRDAVVRNGEKFTTVSGEKVEMSLEKTCLKCHSNAEAFCTRCHDYANVQPTCWACHIEPKGS